MTVKKVKKAVSVLLVIVWCLVLLTVCQQDYNDLMMLFASLGVSTIYFVPFCWVIGDAY